MMSFPESMDMTANSEYDVLSHGRMLRDEIRLKAYTDALRASINPGDVVLEVGTGVGYFAVAAAKLGARHVFAIEPDESIYLARGVLEDNGVAERVTLIRGSALDVNLPEPADILLSDLRGTLPLYRRHLQVIIDARDRLTKSGATLIPRRDHLMVALVSAEKTYEYFDAPWGREEAWIDLQFVRGFSVNCWITVKGSSVRCLSEPREWTTIDYSEVRTEDASGSASLLARDAGTAHGLLVWFDAELADGIALSALSGQVYGQAFFPLESPLSVEEGDRVVVDLEALARMGDYVWTWNSSHVRDGMQLMELQQSTAKSWIIPPE